MGIGAGRERERGWRRKKKRKIGMRTGARTGRGSERGRGWRLVDKHRIRTETGAGTERRAVVEKGTGMRMGTGTGTRTGSRRAEVRRVSSRNRTIVVNAMGETRESWMKREKNVDKVCFSSCRPR